MTSIITLCRAAAVVSACSAASFAWAAATDGIEPEAPAAGTSSATTPIIDYALDTEMVVQHWVLCISQAFAEDLVRAREDSPERAMKAYADLKAAKSCGQFGELRVILRERLYVSSMQSGHDARAFGALVNISGGWANAFVVYGGLPEQ